jgi:hypothetical protein
MPSQMIGNFHSTYATASLTRVLSPSVLYEQEILQDYNPKVVEGLMTKDTFGSCSQDDQGQDSQSNSSHTTLGREPQDS